MLHGRALQITKGSLYDVLSLLMANVGTNNMPKVAKAVYAVRKMLKRVDQYNPVGKAKNNVAHHYDLSGAL